MVSLLESSCQAVAPFWAETLGFGRETGGGYLNGARLLPCLYLGIISSFTLLVTLFITQPSHSFLT